MKSTIANKKSETAKDHRLKPKPVLALMTLCIILSLVSPSAALTNNSQFNVASADQLRSVNAVASDNFSRQQDSAIRIRSQRKSRAIETYQHLIWPAEQTLNGSTFETTIALPGTGSKNTGCLATSASSTPVELTIRGNFRNVTANNSKDPDQLSVDRLTLTNHSGVTLGNVQVMAAGKDIPGRWDDSVSKDLLSAGTTSIIFNVDSRRAIRFKTDFVSKQNAIQTKFILSISSEQGCESRHEITFDQIIGVRGFWINVSLADNLERLLDAAEEDGIRMRGTGYRDPADQIRLRRQNCGTSDFAVYQMSSSRCNPPTAVPGRSRHEQGRAVDMVYIGSDYRGKFVGSPGYRWMQKNAARYGFYNLSSEPWHWSDNGR